MDLCDRNDIQALLARHGFHFAKALGQNFLIRGDVAEDIAAAGCVPGCGVLEVGPGIGALTVQLARRAEKVVSVELDKRLPPVLAETMADYDNFTLIEGDVMALDRSIVFLLHCMLPPLYHLFPTRATKSRKKFVFLRAASPKT